MLMQNELFCNVLMWFQVSYSSHGDHVCSGGQKAAAAVGVTTKQKAVSGHTLLLLLMQWVKQTAKHQNKKKKEKKEKWSDLKVGAKKMTSHMVATGAPKLTLLET